ncbi:hypothetical protein HK102_008642, partial [Quaeritorhiza haematococci]
MKSADDNSADREKGRLSSTTSSNAHKIQQVQNASSAFEFFKKRLSSPSPLNPNKTGVNNNNMDVSKNERSQTGEDVKIPIGGQDSIANGLTPPPPTADASKKQPSTLMRFGSLGTKQSQEFSGSGGGGIGGGGIAEGGDAGGMNVDPNATITVAPWGGASFRDVLDEK